MTNTDRTTIKEAIVVEGRDDEAAVLRAVDAATIATHGFGIRQETLDLISRAYESQGIIIFTDPDHAGDQIRKRLAALFPMAKHAFLTRAEAEQKGDIGIENAAPDSIRSALAAAKAVSSHSKAEFDIKDMWTLGLAGKADSAQRRQEIGRALGIGNGNAKTFLNKMNRFGVTRKELQEVCKNSTQPVEFED
jgi:ribonuclease M5